MCKSLFGFIFKTSGEGDPAQEEMSQTGTQVQAKGERSCFGGGSRGWSARCEGATVLGMEGEQRQCVQPISHDVKQNGGKKSHFQAPQN